MPLIKLNTIYPPSVTAGSTVEVVIEGADLDDAEVLLFSDPAVTAQPKVTPGTSNREPNRFMLTAATNAAPALVDVRVAGRFGISNPRAFVVSALPQINETEPNNSKEQATVLALGHAATGLADSAQYDWFKVSLKKDEEIFLRCLALDLDSRLEPVLTVIDPGGKEIARSLRGSLQFKAATEGEHFVALHDLTFRGGGEYFYRLQATPTEPLDPGRRIPAAAVLPPAATKTFPSETNIFATEVPAEIAGAFTPGLNREVRFTAKKGEVYWLEIFSHRLSYASDPYLLLQKVNRNDKGEQTFADIAETYDLDQNLGGIPFNTSTRDAALRFEAKEDGEYRLVVKDLFNSIKGATAHPFHLSIRPETPGFQLVLFPAHPPNPNKEAKDVPLWSSFLRKEDKTSLDLIVLRRDGFGGEVELSADGLPGGVSFAPTKVPAGISKVKLVFSSDANLSPYAGPLRLSGRARVGDKEIVRPALQGSQTWAVGDYQREAVISRLARETALAASGKEMAPITLDLAEERIFETSVAGKVQIPIRVSRRGEFNNNLKFRVETEPLKEFELDAKATNGTIELDLNQTKLAAGTHTIHWLANTTGKYRRLTPEEIQAIEQQIKTANESIPPLDQEIARLNEEKKKPEAKAAELDAAIKEAQGRKEAAANLAKSLGAKIQPADVNFSIYGKPFTVQVHPAPIQLALGAPGGSMGKSSKSEVAVKINRLFGYNEPVELAVVLPQNVKGLSAQKVTIAPGATEAKLVVESATDAPAGEQKLSIQAVAKLNGQELKVEQPFTLAVAN